MLADHSKLKLMPSLVEQNKAIPELEENDKSSDSDSEIIENDYEDVETENNSPKFYNEKDMKQNLIMKKEILVISMKKKELIF